MSSSHKTSKPKNDEMKLIIKKKKKMKNHLYCNSMIVGKEKMT